MHPQCFNIQNSNSKACTNVLSVGYLFLLGKSVSVTKVFFKKCSTEKQNSEGLEYG